MTAQTFYRKHFNTITNPTGCDVMEKGYTYRELIGFAKAFAESTMYPENYEEFKFSQRAYKLSLEIDLQFEIQLLPRIKRRYRNNEVVKFEMHTAAGKIYYFDGLVQDFLSREAVIKQKNDHFIMENF